MTENNPVSPRHYDFEGVQLLSVTRCLTSNGGQAVQYIARATRTDGQNKAQTVAGLIEDLRKARVFLDDEIDWLEAAQAFPQRYILGVPRVWDRIAEVPPEVSAVEDCDGDLWVWGTDAYDRNRWPTVTGGRGEKPLGDAYAPFTEVLT